MDIQQLELEQVLSSLMMLCPLIFGGWAVNVAKKSKTNLLWTIYFIVIYLVLGDYDSMIMFFMGYLLEGVYPIYKTDFS